MSATTSEYLKGSSRLTHGSNNLRLQPILILEPSSKIAHTAFTIRLHIRHFADVVEHVAGGEEQDHDQADCGPEVAVLDNGQDVGRGDGEEGDESEDGGGDGDDFDVVDWADDGWVGDVGELAREPGVDRVGSVGAGCC